MRRHHYRPLLLVMIDNSRINRRPWVMPSALGNSCVFARTLADVSAVDASTMMPSAVLEPARPRSGYPIMAGVSSMARRQPPIVSRPSCMLSTARPKSMLMAAFARGDTSWLASRSVRVLPCWDGQFSGRSRPQVKPAWRTRWHKYGPSLWRLCSWPASPGPTKTHL